MATATADTSQEESLLPDSPISGIPDVMSLLTLNKSAHDIGAKNVAAAAQAQEQYNLLGSLTNDIASRQGTLGNTTMTPAMVMTENLFKLGVEDKMQALAAAAGKSTDATIDIGAILLSDIRDQTYKILQTSKEVEDMKSVSLFDDPLTAIMNAFKLPWAQQKLESMQDHQKASVASLTDISAGLTNSAVAEKAVARTMTQADILEQNTALQGMLKNQRDNILISGSERKIAGITFAMNASSQELARQHMLFNAQNTEESQQLQRENAARMRTQFDWQKLEKADETSALTAKLGYINSALRRTGAPPIIDVSDLKRRYKMSPASAKFLDDLTDKGMLLSMPNGELTYSDGEPGNAQSYITNWSVLNKPATTQDQLQYQQIMRDAAEYDKIHAKTGQGTKGNDYIKTFFDEHYNTVKKDDGSNPNRAMTFATAADRAARTTDPVFKSVFRDAIAPFITDANKSQSAHPDIVGPLVVSAVQQGKITPNQGAMFLADFYKASVSIANTQSDVYAWTGQKFSAFKTKVDTGIPIARTIGGVATMVGGEALGVGIGTGAVTTGLGAVGLPAVGVALTNPYVAGGIAIAGAGALAYNAMSMGYEYDWTDPVKTQAYIVRRVYDGFTSLNPGETFPAGTIPRGAPVR
jgi:hypothetical protein